MLSPEWVTLTDPVCGRSVEVDSPFRSIHGGALFAFCSPTCRAQFAALPSRYAVIANAALVPPPAVETPPPPAAAPAVAAPPRLTTPPAAASVASAPAAPITPASVPAPAQAHSPAPAQVHMPAPAQVHAPARATTARPSTDEHPATPTWDTVDLQSLAGAAGPFTWLLAWRERRFASECAHTLMKIHREQTVRYPELHGEMLYRRIVASHLGGDHAAVDAVLRFARQSFAIWPTERELNFRDVVHYLAVSQFMAEHGHARWVYADMKRIVHAIVPANL